MIPGSDKLYEQIESWLDGQLQEQEAAAFAARLEKDVNLKECVERVSVTRSIFDKIWLKNEGINVVFNSKKEFDVQFRKTFVRPDDARKKSLLEDAGKKAKLALWMLKEGRQVLFNILNKRFGEDVAKLRNRLIPNANDHFPVKGYEFQETNRYLMAVSIWWKDEGGQSEILHLYEDFVREFLLSDSSQFESIVESWYKDIENYSFHKDADDEKIFNLVERHQKAAEKGEIEAVEQGLYQQVESWLDAQLLEPELAAFKARLEKDEDLRERVEQHRLARLAIDGWVTENYKDQATLWREAMELQEKALAKRKRLWWIIGLSALALIICVMAFGVFKNRINEGSSPQTPEETIVPVPKQLSGDTDKSQINSSVGSEIPSLTNDRSSKKTPQKVKLGRKKASSKPKERKMADQEAIAYADENLKDYWAIVEERTRGISRSASSPGHFEFGCQAYSKEDWPKAEQELLQVKSQDGGDFTNALELLAIVAFKQKKYAEAALYYEQFAPRKIGPATDWRLVLYYLADYPARKNELYTSLEKILQSSEHPFNKQGRLLETELRKKK